MLVQSAFEGQLKLLDIPARAQEGDDEAPVQVEALPRPGVQLTPGSSIGEGSYEAKSNISNVIRLVSRTVANVQDSL